jgi:hypothetical protein
MALRCVTGISVQMSKIGSKQHEKPLTRHSREGGNPVVLAAIFLDSRLRGNDELSASQCLVKKRLQSAIRLTACLAALVFFSQHCDGPSFRIKSDRETVRDGQIGKGMTMWKSGHDGNRAVANEVE